MRLASFTDYSLRVLIYLAIKGEERSTVSEIADKYMISKNHLVKVVHNLSNMKIIDSFKGKGGGIVLTKAPSTIKIGKIIRELESESALVECFGTNSSCAINPSCKLKAALKVAENKFYEALDDYTLEDILVNKDKLSSSLGLN